MDVAVVIPAYKPGAELVDLVRMLERTPIASIIVVDDGSGSAYQALFDEIRSCSRVTVLRHAVNLGKGSALKTGLNHVLCDLSHYLGAVTADADGQHHVNDIVGVVAQFQSNPRSLVLGARQFEQRNVPWRSQFGNRLTRQLVRLLIGQDLTDTQTGLRAIPIDFIPILLRIQSSGYEYELDMLIAAKHHQIPIAEQPIRTIYQHGNSSSHFNPLLDSLRIYFVLLRFTAVSLMSALLDNTMFILVYRTSGSVLTSQVIARAISCSFNYAGARKAVFLSRGSHTTHLPRYLALVLFSTSISYVLITLLTTVVSSVVLAKLMGETLLFLFNFAVQRDFVFRRPADTSR